MSPGRLAAKHLHSRNTLAGYVANLQNKCKSDCSSCKELTIYFTLTHMKIVSGKVPAIIMRDTRTKIQPKHPSLPEFLSAETVKCVGPGVHWSHGFAAIPLVWDLNSN